ncbi:MAG: hypothetical protein UU78_C0040G0012, partial [Candidatus Roizmanbacteria bacterium GW2011_GWC2_41_7]
KFEGKRFETTVGRLLFNSVFPSDFPYINEEVTGKKMKPQWETYLHQIGMIILLGLLLMVTINDILRFTAG